MKRIILFLNFLFFVIYSAFPQAGEWVWLKGDSTFYQLGNFGVQGVPGPFNNPPGLYETSEWTDLNGNFWLFGGKYDDLWKYDKLTNEWTWMKGDSTILSAGNYGVQGVSSPLNNPPHRQFGSMSWVDNQNNLWMFGGYTTGYLNDLWKYDISTNEWTWINGSNLTNQAGNYGIQGVPSPTNSPPPRCENAVAWKDNADDLWMFGGSKTYNEFYNDVWRYNIAANEWTWMKGSQLTNQPGIYGTLGAEDSVNTPGARGAYARGKDNSGMVWVFGGGQYGSSVRLNDLWRYNPVTNNWAWMGGDSTINSNGLYGTKCVSSPDNIPAARFENRAAWTDQAGNFWSFGGHSYNDLWKYCISTNQWIWQSGDSISNPPGHWGIIGVSSPANMPNGRSGSSGWRDNNNLYLFGGLANSGYHNDLWKYTIDTTCGACPTSTNIRENNFLNELVVFPNPANSSFTISFSPPGKQIVELRIYNTLGKKVYFLKEEVTGGKFEKEINVEKLSRGIYFLQVKMKKVVVSKKVVVER